MSEASTSGASEMDERVEKLIRQHVPAAQVSGRRASELSFRLPKDSSSWCAVFKMNAASPERPPGNI